MDKIEVVYIHKGILFNHEKGGYPATATTWMEREHIMLSEVNQRKTCYHL